MNLEIDHITRYTYSSAVFLEPHHIRFKPRRTPHSILHEHLIDIVPVPAGRSFHTDAEENHILFCWFKNLHQELKITAKSVLETTDYDPFEFLIHPGDSAHMPLRYDDVTTQLLKPSLRSIPLSGHMKTYSEGILEQSDNQTVAFLSELTRRIHNEFENVTREFGEPLKPETTFIEKSGTCRDLAWMQIQLLRDHGIAARFVSGYFYAGSEATEFELHAWLEVYLPGAGWIGLDPSHGIFTGNHHIPVSASAFYENTMPVTGSIRGDAVSRMTHELKISVVEK